MTPERHPIPEASMNTPIFSGGDLRVRWATFNGPSPWFDCEEVSIVGTFVVINTLDSVIVVPDHIIRGRLEVTERLANP